MVTHPVDPFHLHGQTLPQGESLITTRPVRRQHHPTSRLFQVDGSADVFLIGYGTKYRPWRLPTPNRGLLRADERGVVRASLSPSLNRTEPGLCHYSLSSA